MQRCPAWLAAVCWHARLAEAACVARPHTRAQPSGLESELSFCQAIIAQNSELTQIEAENERLAAEVRRACAYHHAHERTRAGRSRTGPLRGRLLKPRRASWSSASKRSGDAASERW